MFKKTASFLSAICVFYMPVFGQLVDKNATVETRNLFKNLHKISGKQVLFGHQDAMAYGVGWRDEPGRSDIKELTGEYPAVLGSDVAGLERDNEKNLDGVPFEKIKTYIKKAYDLGLINTLSWHMDNPVNGKTAWDNTPNTVKSLIPGGEKHELYKTWLDKFAVFVKSLKGSDGKAIPVLFRPFHELNGDWFWWGSKSSSPEEYKALFKFTVDYLKDQKQLHNILYVYNPCGFKTEAEYLERYPGDGYADILSFDDYQTGPVTKGPEFLTGLKTKLDIQQKIAEKSNKITAIAEMGYVEIPDAKWWSSVFVPAIKANKPAYVLVWRNAGYRKQENDYHYYAPYKGQVSAADFIDILNRREILLQKGVSKYSIYK